MIRKIILENYMAHIRTVIEPAAGLTVLIGPNNCGKSAVAHAMEMICHNSDAASFAIRHGTKKATVTVETVDAEGTAHTLVWWRTKGTAGYSIDGREISNMGKGKIPDDLHDYLKMPEIESPTGKPFRIHFGLQKEPIFLLDDPPSRAAQFFATSSDADRLMEMQRRHKQKESNARRDRERLDQEIARLDLKLIDLIPLGDLSAELMRSEAAHAAIGLAEDRLRAMSNAIDALQQGELTERSCLDRSAALTALRVTPVLQLVESLVRQINSLALVAQQAAVNQAKVKSLDPLSDLPALVDTSPLSRFTANLDGVHQRCRREARRVAATAALPVVPEQGDARSLSQRIDALALAIEKLARVKQRCALLEKMSAVPAELNAGPLSDLLARLEKAYANANAAHHVAQKARKNLETLDTQIALFIEQNPLCQNCGQAVSAELIVTGGHAHE